MKLADLLPPPVRAGLTITAALLAVIASWWVCHTIYKRGWEAAAAVYEAEKEALRKANEAAIESARQKLMADIVKLREENKRLEDAIAEIDAEADQDPDAERLGISPNSVRRISSVR